MVDTENVWMYVYSPNTQENDVANSFANEAIKLLYIKELQNRIVLQRSNTLTVWLVVVCARATAGGFSMSENKTTTYIYIYIHLVVMTKYIFGSLRSSLTEHQHKYACMPWVTITITIQ